MERDDPKKQNTVGTTWDQLRGVPFAGEQRVSESDFDKLERGLKASNATELLAGRLPEEQNKEFGEGVDYILATNQSGIYSFEQMSEYLKENGGINTNVAIDETGGVTMRRGGKANALSDRFYIPGRVAEKSDGTADFRVNKNEMLQVLTGGYEGTMDSFRFVVAIPFAAEKKEQYDWLMRQAILDAPGSTLASGLIEEGMVPEDFLVQRGVGRDAQFVVNKKYIAGVVDNEGKYTQNTNFGVK